MDSDDEYESIIDFDDEQYAMPMKEERKSEIFQTNLAIEKVINPIH